MPHDQLMRSKDEIGLVATEHGTIGSAALQLLKRDEEALLELHLIDAGLVELHEPLHVLVVLRERHAKHLYLSRVEVSHVLATTPLLLRDLHIVLVSDREPHISRVVNRVFDLFLRLLWPYLVALLVILDEIRIGVVVLLQVDQLTRPLLIYFLAVQHLIFHM